MTVDDVIEKIRKLFALSSSPNEHESALALQRARELMLKYDLEMKDVEHREFERKNYGLSNHWHIEDKYILLLIDGHFNVRAMKYHRSLIHTKGKYVLVGKHHDILFAEYVFDYLFATFRTLWKEYRKTRRVRRKNRRALHESYVRGLFVGLDNNLTEQSIHLQEEGLILCRNAKLDDFVNDNFVVVNHSNSIAYKNRYNDALLHGYHKGKSIDINKPLESSTLKLLTH